MSFAPYARATVATVPMVRPIITTRSRKITWVAKLSEVSKLLSRWPTMIVSMARAMTWSRLTPMIGAASAKRRRVIVR